MIGKNQQFVKLNMRDGLESKIGNESVYSWMILYNLHIFSNSSILVNNCSFDMGVSANTNWNTAFNSQKTFISFCLEIRKSMLRLGLFNPCNLHKQMNELSYI
jgi:hypothetical protein